jgi:hypothetical protein
MIGLWVCATACQHDRPDRIVILQNLKHFLKLPPHVHSDRVLAFRPVDDDRGNAMGYAVL